jgi:hypothetical protein
VPLERTKPSLDKRVSERTLRRHPERQFRLSFHSDLSRVFQWGILSVSDFHDGKGDASFPDTAGGIGDGLIV